VGSTTGAPRIGIEPITVGFGDQLAATGMA